MGFLTINLDMTGREALVVGAGRVGRRKIADLLKAGARVRVVEPSPDPAIASLAAEGRLRLEPAFEEAFLEARPLIFCAVPDPAVGRRLAALARSRGLWINVADQPADCDFHMPAVAEHGALRLAVTTGGASPALAAAVAAELRLRYRGHGRLADLLGRLRPRVMAADLDEGRRRAILLAAAADPDLPALLAEGRDGEALARLRELAAPVEPPDDWTL